MQEVEKQQMLDYFWKKESRRISRMWNKPVADWKKPIFPTMPQDRFVMVGAGKELDEDKSKDDK